MSNVCTCPAEERYAFLDHFPEGYQLIGPDFQYLYVNHAVAIQGKRTKDDLIGSTMMEKYPGIDQSEMFQLLKRCFISSESVSMVNTFTFSDGEERFFELRIRKVPEGVLIISEDITERKKMEDENKQLFEAMIRRENRMAELKRELEQK